MAKTKAPGFAPVPIDPSSGDVVLEYIEGRTPRYVPACDLSGNDLARIAYRRAADTVRASRSSLVQPGAERAQPSRPALATSEDLEALAFELSASGRFWRTMAPVGVPPEVEPAAEPEVISTPEPSIEPPAEPAPEPEA